MASEWRRPDGRLPSVVTRVRHRRRERLEEIARQRLREPPRDGPQTELAEWIGVSYPRLNELIHGKRSLTPDTALRLEQVFDMDAQFWLTLQLAWDLYHARRSPAARKIARIRRHPSLATVE